jgi:hypothetical protein
MENRDQFQPLASDPVRDDVRGIRYDKLACAENAPGATHLGPCFEQIDGFENATRYESCILLRIAFNVLSKVDEVADRPAGPDDFHFGAFVSPGLPQDFSHFNTFSWLTSCPESSSAIPA